ncbi:HTH_Tnp_Tc3_2 domain-containing protein [Trichonephila clavipes]|nr:HTH_Tnp_Tc3_2 domain-containing protein [Trichonephila clavipes]
MQCDGAFRIAGRGRLKSFTVECKTGNQSLFECAESFTKEEMRPLPGFRRQYEQLSQLKRGRIIGMMEAEWSARREARQLGHPDSVVRRCWDQWIQEMSFTRRPGSGRPRQASCQEDHHVVGNAHAQPIAS